MDCVGSSRLCGQYFSFTLSDCSLVAPGALWEGIGAINLQVEQLELL